MMQRVDKRGRCRYYRRDAAGRTQRSDQREDPRDLEDKIEGFVREPFAEIAARRRRSGRGDGAHRGDAPRGNGAPRSADAAGDESRRWALVAWKVAPERIDAAFDYMSQQDPFSGHVVLRSTDSVTPGSEYKLWTTLKVPRGFSLQRHGELLAERVGADHFRLMPAKGIFTLGVGHVRRKTMEPGSKADVPAKMAPVHVAELNDLEWRVLLTLKREFAPEEITPNPWARAPRKRVCRSRSFVESRSR
jgi:hypothetical protein